MTDLADKVDAANSLLNTVNGKLDTIAAQVASIQSVTTTAPTVDFTAVLAAIADVKAQLVPTPVAPVTAAAVATGTEAATPAA